MRIRILIVVTALIITSCNKNLLEQSSPNSISSDQVFADPDLAALLLNSIYGDVPSFDHDLYDNIADESRNFWGGAPKNVDDGQWFADNNPMEYWAYSQVRKTNEFLENINQVELTDDEINEMKGQVKVLRAKLYFDMAKRYGGVPIITEPQGLDDDDLMVSRASMDDTFDFIINEIKDAIDVLPESYGSTDIDVAKWNKYSAKAFLGRVLLFWASKLYNQNEDQSRWEKAADANWEVIQSHRYSLHDDYRRIMLDKNNEEEIFSVQYRLGIKEHGWDSWAMPDSRSRQDASRRCPVQEFVDAFEMKNGKRIDEPGSGYDENDPYVNRDPRFYDIVIFNGSTFGYQDLPVYSYLGGDDGINEPYETVTGYYMRKGTDENNTTYYGGTGSDQNWIELRYAEVLLNYAEARNEQLQFPDATIYEAIEAVRKRAGLEPYQLTSGLNKEEMRDVIRHERYIELSFEQKRYWDLRRWKTAKEVLDGKTFGAMYITKEGDGSYTHERGLIEGQKGVFQDKMYLMPIPLRETERNPNLLPNNPGWD